MNIYSNPNYITAQAENSAVMLLDGFIGTQVLGGAFTRELRHLDAQGLDEITIKLNSGGGDVFHGWEIFSAIEDAETPIHIDVVGMAASMAAGLLLAADRVTARDYSMIMIHAASFGGEPADAAHPDKVKLLGDVNAAFHRVITARTNLDEDQVNVLLNGLDHWYSATEALEAGLINKVRHTTQKQAKKVTAESETIIAEVNNILSQKGTVGEIYAAYDNYINTKPNSMKLVTAELKLEDNATEGEVVTAIQNIEKQVITVEGNVVTAEAHNALVTENESLKAELKVQNDATEAAHLVAIEAKVTKAIEDGKVNKESNDLYVTMGVENEEQLDAVLASLITDGVHPGSIDAKLEDNGVVVEKYPTMSNEETYKKDDVSTWNYRNWEKNDPQGLQAIVDTDKDKANKMYADCYGQQND